MSPLPALTPGQWTAFSGNTLRNVLYTQGGLDLSNLLAYSTPPSIMTAWTSATVDTLRDVLVIAAPGGDPDYPGNETYEWSISGTQLWSRRPLNGGEAFGTVPTVGMIPDRHLVAQPPNSVYNDSTGSPIEEYAGGTPPTMTYPANRYPNGANLDSTGNRRYPTARHHYGGHIFMPTTGEIALVGGGGRLGTFTDTIFSWKPTTEKWTYHNLDRLSGKGVTGAFNEGYICVWDPINQQVWGTTRNGLFRFKPTNAAGSRSANLGDDSTSGNLQYCQAIYDTKRHRIVLAGYRGDANALLSEGMSYYDQYSSNPNLRRSFFGLSPGWANASAGLIYDPIADRYIGWNGGQTLHSLDPDTGVDTPLPIGGATPTAAAPFTYGKFFYSPTSDVYGVVNSIDGSVYLYKPIRTQIQVSLGTFHQFASPFVGQGIGSNGMKHCTLTHCPDDGNVYIIGGDYSSIPSSGFQSYRQVLNWFNATEKWNDPANPASGWHLIYDERGPLDGTPIPKFPDFIVLAWDSTNHLLHTLPGTYESRDAEVAGETSSIPQPGGGSITLDDPNFKTQHWMTMPISTKRWTDQGTNTQAVISGTSRNNSDNSWQGFYDKVANRLVRPLQGQNSGGCSFSPVLSTFPPTGAWSYTECPDPQTMRWGKSTPSWDRYGRFMYFIDAVHGRLWRLSVAGWAAGLGSAAWTRMADIPYGAMVNTDGQEAENFVYSCYDDANSVMHFYRIGPNPTTGLGSGTYHIFNPSGGPTGGFPGSWTEIPITVTAHGAPAVFFNARTLVYDPIQNVVIFMGLTESTGNYRIHFFRYGQGGGSITPPPGDVTSPTVSITFPANGATVSGTFTIQATANDDAGGTGVRGVLFRRDGTVNLGAEDTTAPYSQVWDSTTVPDGLHTLHALATDNAGNTGQAIITVTVDNIPLPALVSLNPSSGPAGALVTLFGTGFGATQGGGFVTFGGVVAQISSWTDTQIAILVPALAPGNYSVFVTTAGGVSNSLPFTIPAPTQGGSRSPTFVTRLRGWS